MAADRKAEIRSLLALGPAEVIQRAGDRLVVCETLDALHWRFAMDAAALIRGANRSRTPVCLLLPVGPQGQYPLLADMINRDGLSLADSWLFFMDEYCDEEGRALPPEHPLSFRGAAQRAFFSRLRGASGLRMEQVLFPDETTIDRYAQLIRNVGGLDCCFGGIGIHGHLAFNEPEPGVKRKGSRRVRLNDFTVTMNAIRAGVGGNIECFPRHALTVGMREILSARQLRLYCRNGMACDWANTVLRLALFGTPGDDYPVTHIRGLDYVITTDRATLASPSCLL